jgi:cystathionine gamma-synthase/methionine-gamma-lyase
VQHDSTRARTEGLDPATRAVHVGERPSRPEFTPVVTPIYPGSTYVYEDLEEMDAALGGAEGKYVYTRYGNPTSSALETVIADLEGTSSAVAFASGMAAVHAAITTSVAPGQAIVASRDLYGATYSMLSGFMREWGCTVEFVDMLDLAQVSDAVARLKPALIVCEVISNPLLRVTDVPAVVQLAKSVRAAVLVDSTFSPVIYSPAADGAQLVVHSLTKYISGHGDVTGGVVATTSMRREKLVNFVKMAGGLLGPFESWLALRGVKTLPLRMERQCASATIVADAIAAHPLVSRVYYPGLADHPSHETAEKLFGGRGFGGMIAFEIKDAGREEVVDFLEALDLIVPATSLGDVYSLALSPAMSSHRALTPEERSAFGIAEGLVRLSVGIEAPTDILADLDRALQAAARRSVHATA